MDEQEQFPFLYIPCYVQELSLVWENFLHLGKKITYKKGDKFFLGENEDAFGYIKSGLTCCYVKEEVGHVDEIRFFIGKGCLIKETFISANYGKFYTYHKCLTDVEMYQFDRNMILNGNAFNSHPELVKNYIFSISAKSVSAQLFASLLKQKSNLQKVAVYIYGFHLLNGRSLSFSPPLTQIQLAELLGLTNLTVNRIIGKLKRDNVIACYTKNKLQILDIEKIKALRVSSE